MAKGGSESITDDYVSKFHWNKKKKEDPFTLNDGDDHVSSSEQKVFESD